MTVSFEGNRIEKLLGSLVRLATFVASPAALPLTGAITCHGFALRNHPLGCSKSSCMRLLS